MACRKQRECFVPAPLLLPSAQVCQGWALGPQGCRSVGGRPSCWVQLPPCLGWHCPLALCGGWSRFVLSHTPVLWLCAADAAWHCLAEFWLSPAEGGSPLGFFPLAVTLSCAVEF